MKKLMFTLALLLAFTGQAQAELTWKKMQAGASGSSSGTGSIKQIQLVVEGERKVFISGVNSAGQFGNGTTSTTTQMSPIEILDFANAKKCYAQQTKSVGCITYDNKFKFLSNSTSYSVVEIPALSNAKECSVSDNDILCVMNDETVKGGSWDNIQVLPDFYKALSCDTSGGTRVCVIDNGSGGTIVKTWGANNNGRLGQGDRLNNYGVARQIAGFSNASKCWTFFVTICVMKDGSFKSTGDLKNNLGQLVYFSTYNVIPITFPNMVNAKECSLGYPGYPHLVCIMQNKKVLQLSYGASATPTPTEIPELEGAISCSNGSSVTGAYAEQKGIVCSMPNGTIKTFGSGNVNGRFGNGTLSTVANGATLFPSKGSCTMNRNTTVCTASVEKLESCDPAKEGIGTYQNNIYACVGTEWKKLKFSN